MSNVLAIDQGTSGTKAVVVDPSGGVLASAEVELRPTYLPDGGVEQDPRALFESVVVAGRRAIAEAGQPVAAVGLANQGETVLAWDRATGEPRSAAVVWQDRRAEPVCAELSDSKQQIEEISGLVLDAYFSAPKMRWLRDNITSRGVVTTSDVRCLRYGRDDGEPFPAVGPAVRRLERRAGRIVRPVGRAHARGRSL